MESRMEKYYKEDLSEFNRIKKNEKLYKRTYIKGIIINEKEKTF